MRLERRRRGSAGLGCEIERERSALKGLADDLVMSVAQRCSLPTAVCLDRELARMTRIEVSFHLLTAVNWHTLPWPYRTAPAL